MAVPAGGRVMLLCHFWSVATRHWEPSTSGVTEQSSSIHPSDKYSHKAACTQVPTEPASLLAQIPSMPASRLSTLCVFSLISSVACGIRWEFCFDSQACIRFHKHALSADSASPNTNPKGDPTKNGGAVESVNVPSCLTVISHGASSSLWPLVR